MDSVCDWDESESELLQAQSHILNQIFCFINSMSLKSAVQLGIPDLIRRHGRPITVPELSLALHIPLEKSKCLFRLMRILVHSGFFDMVQPHGDGEPTYALNRSSKLLLTDNPFNMSPLVLGALDPIPTNPCHYIGAWFLNDKATPFETAFGMNFWEKTGHDSSWNDVFNESMASDTKLLASVLVNGPGKVVFEGIDSLVDVGGGTGTLAKAIADAFPHIDCTVLDLPQVVSDLKGSKNLKFIEGDMFEKVPPADAVLLKSILHDWGDDECVNILKRSRDSISQRRNRGKVMVIDMVVGNANADKRTIITQLRCDVSMMAVCSGKERTENEWAKLFSDAGFSGYKINPINLGLRSLIEVYP